MKGRRERRVWREGGGGEGGEREGEGVLRSMNVWVYRVVILSSRAVIGVVGVVVACTARKSATL